jgi:hypothetical protein
MLRGAEVARPNHDRVRFLERWKNSMPHLWIAAGMSHAYGSPKVTEAKIESTGATALSSCLEN